MSDVAYRRRKATKASIAIASKDEPRGYNGSKSPQESHYNISYLASSLKLASVTSTDFWIALTYLC